MKKSETGQTEKKPAPAKWARWAVGGGLAMTAATAVYMDVHEVRDQKDAMGSISVPFTEHQTYIDQSEIPAALAGGLGGLVLSIFGVVELIESRRQNHDQ